MSYPYLIIDGHKVSLIPPFTIDDKLICKIISHDAADTFEEINLGTFGFHEPVRYNIIRRYSVKFRLETGEEITICHDVNSNLSLINDEIRNEFERIARYSYHGNSYIRSECLEYLRIHTCSITRCLNNDIQRQCHDIEFGRPLNTYFEELHRQGRYPCRYAQYDRLIYGEPLINNNRVAFINAFNSIIHPHSYKPTYNKHFMIGESESTTLLLGAEIEVDCGGKSEEHAKEVLQIMNGKDTWNSEENIYCVHDGSLSNGLEFPTQPGSLAWHKSLPYQKMFKYLDENGYKAHDTKTCGLHVHINRSFFADKEKECIGKLIYIVEKFNNEFSVIGRRNCKYSQFIGYKGEKCNELYEKGTNGGIGKYQAVNLLHDDSIEIRAFKGTLKYSTFMNTLEFVSDLAHFVKNHTEEDVENMEWSDLYDTFSDELKKYYDERKQIESEKAKSNTMTETDRVGTFACWDRNRDSNLTTSSSFFNFDSAYALFNYNVNRAIREELAEIERLNSHTENLFGLQVLGRFQEPAEKTNEEKVKDLKQKLKTEQNYMAKIKLQQEISQLQKEIKLEKKRKKRENSNNQ